MRLYGNKGLIRPQRAGTRGRAKQWRRFLQKTRKRISLLEQQRVDLETTLGELREIESEAKRYLERHPSRRRSGRE